MEVQLVENQDTSKHYTPYPPKQTTQIPYFANELVL